jgi:hypothetical protein
MATETNTSKPILYWIALTTIFASLVLGAVSTSQVETTLTVEDLIVGGGSLEEIVETGKPDLKPGDEFERRRSSTK